MRVLHIIPTAFNYFDDIRAEAFKILHTEGEHGIDANALTLDYGSTSKSDEEEVGEVAPKAQFLGHHPMRRAMESWNDYDVVNLHCPFLGAASKILDWANKNKDKNLIITYHHDFRTPDFFSLIIKIYNIFYLPKLFKVAKRICFFGGRRRESSTGILLTGKKNDRKTVVLGQSGMNKDINNELVAEDLVMVYNSMTLEG